MRSERVRVRGGQQKRNILCRSHTIVTTADNNADSQQNRKQASTRVEQHVRFMR